MNSILALPIGGEWVPSATDGMNHFVLFIVDTTEISLRLSLPRRSDRALEARRFHFSAREGCLVRFRSAFQLSEAFSGLAAGPVCAPNPRLPDQEMGFHLRSLEDWSAPARPPGSLFARDPQTP